MADPIVNVNTAGAVIPAGYGRIRVRAIPIDVQERGVIDYTDRSGNVYEKFVNFKLLFCEGPAYLQRLWLKDTLILDRRPVPSADLQLSSLRIWVYDGNELQQAPSSEDYAYRGRAYAIFEQFPLEQYDLQDSLPEFYAEMLMAVTPSITFSDPVKGADSDADIYNTGHFSVSYARGRAYIAQKREPADTPTEDLETAVIGLGSLQKIGSYPYFEPRIADLSGHIWGKPPDAGYGSVIIDSASGSVIHSTGSEFEVGDGIGLIYRDTSDTVINFVIWLTDENNGYQHTYLNPPNFAVRTPNALGEAVVEEGARAASPINGRADNIGYGAFYTAAGVQLYKIEARRYLAQNIRDTSGTVAELPLEKLGPRYDVAIDLNNPARTVEAILYDPSQHNIIAICPMAGQNTRLAFLNAENGEYRWHYDVPFRAYPPGELARAFVLSGQRLALAFQDGQIRLFPLGRKVPDADLPAPLVANMPRSWWVESQQTMYQVTEAGIVKRVLLHDMLTPLLGGRATQQVTLEYVLLDLCRKAGLDVDLDPKNSEVRVDSDLGAIPIHGFLQVNRTQVRAAIDELQTYFDFRAAEIDGQIVFKRISEAEDVNVDRVLRYGRDNTVDEERVSPPTLPTRMSFDYYDIDDDFRRQTVTARRAIVPANPQHVEQSFHIVDNEDNARRRAEAALYNAWLRTEFRRLRLGWEYLRVTAMDTLALKSLDGIKGVVDAVAIGADNALELTLIPAKNHDDTRVLVSERVVRIHDISNIPEKTSVDLEATVNLPEVRTGDGAPVQEVEASRQWRVTQGGFVGTLTDATKAKARFIADDVDIATRVTVRLTVTSTTGRQYVDTATFLILNRAPSVLIYPPPPAEVGDPILHNGPVNIDITYRNGTRPAGIQSRRLMFSQGEASAAVMILGRVNNRERAQIYIDGALPAGMTTDDDNNNVEDALDSDGYAQAVINVSWRGITVACAVNVTRVEDGEDGDPGDDGTSYGERYLFKAYAKGAAVPAKPTRVTWVERTQTLASNDDWLVAHPNPVPIGGNPGPSDYNFQTQDVACIAVRVGSDDTAEVLGEARPCTSQGGINVVFARSVDKPGKLARGPKRIPDGTVDVEADVPAGEGSIWAAVGHQAPFDGNWDWQDWIKLEGTDGENAVTHNGPIVLDIQYKTGVLPPGFKSRDLVFVKDTERRTIQILGRVFNDDQGDTQVRVFVNEAGAKGLNEENNPGVTASGVDVGDVRAVDSALAEDGTGQAEMAVIFEGVSVACVVNALRAEDGQTPAPSPGSYEVFRTGNAKPATPPVYVSNVVVHLPYLPNGWFRSAAHAIAVAEGPVWRSLASATFPIHATGYGTRIEFSEAYRLEAVLPAETSEELGIPDPDKYYTAAENQPAAPANRPNLPARIVSGGNTWLKGELPDLGEDEKYWESTPNAGTQQTGSNPNPGNYYARAAAQPTTPPAQFWIVPLPTLEHDGVTWMLGEAPEGNAQLWELTYNVRGGSSEGGPSGGVSRREFTFNAPTQFTLLDTATTYVFTRPTEWTPTESGAGFAGVTLAETSYLTGDGKTTGLAVDVDSLVGDGDFTVS